MEYPTIDEVNKAERHQLCAWYRHLHSPGMTSLESDDFRTKLNEETEIMILICKRYKELSGDK